jgi:hypothetical protein
MIERRNEMNTKRSKRRLQKLIRHYGFADARGQAIPLFVSRSLNFAVMHEGDRVRENWRMKKYRRKKEKLYGSD